MSSGNAPERLQGSSVETERFMAKENGDRDELERRLEQARRMANQQTDPVTRERLVCLVRELEDQLRE